MGRPIAAGIAAAFGALALAGAASGTIVVQKGMAGVRLGMTQAQVRTVLGEPLRVVHGENEFGSFIELVYPFLVRVTLQGDATVTGLSTTGRHERTATGAGVGSTEAQLRARVPGLTCRTELGFRHCFRGRFEAGKRVTDFHLRAGRVARVVVGFVID